MKRVVVLGSTGSVGRQALDVLRDHGDRFKVVGLAGGKNADLLFEQAREFKPDEVCLSEAGKAPLCEAAIPSGTRFLAGMESVVNLARRPDADIVIAAIGGYAGLATVLAAVSLPRRVAIASKEALVAGGPLVMRAARDSGAEVIPVDSEHSAVFQCIKSQGAYPDRIILTASGGPFRERPAVDLLKVTPAEAMKHPNWRMGAKVTVDSATLMNKGLEVIEAGVLFNMPVDKIDVIVHPQSIIHSMVEMPDGSVIAQLASPDMRGPIAYALSCPERLPSVVRRLDLTAGLCLSFEKPDEERFPALALGYAAGRTGGTMPAVLSAADEIAVERFISGNLGFTRIAEVVSTVMSGHALVNEPTLEDLASADRWARNEASLVCDSFCRRSGVS